MKPNSNNPIAPTGKNVLYISLLLTLLFVIWGVVFPENLDLVASTALKFLTVNFGWLYLSSVFFVLLFIIGSLLAPTAFSFIWLAIFGGTALNLEIFTDAAIGSAVTEKLASALFVTLANFPLSAVTSFLSIILIAAFFITLADSGTFVVVMLTSGGDQEPARKLKAAWGILLGGVAAVLLVAGGLEALQTASIASAFPFMIVMLVMCYALIKGFTQD